MNRELKWKQQVRRTNMKIFYTIFFGIGLACICLLISGVHLFQVYRDVDAKIYEASVAGTPERMAATMDEVIASMEYYGMTHGCFFPLLCTSRGDMRVAYESLKTVQMRAHANTQLSISSDAYQNGMIDTRDMLMTVSIDGIQWAAWRFPPAYLWIIILIATYLILTWINR